MGIQGIYGIHGYTGYIRYTWEYRVYMGIQGIHGNTGYIWYTLVYRVYMGIQSIEAIHGNTGYTWYTWGYRVYRVYRVYMGIQGINGYIYRVYMSIQGIKLYGIHEYTWVYMSVDSLLLLYETVGLFGVSVTSKNNPKMKTDFMQTVNLLTIELQLRVEGSNNLFSLFFFFNDFKKSYEFFSLKPGLKSSSDCQNWPGL